MSGRRQRLAVVVQRYGAEVTGGSESLARAVAGGLAEEDEVTVFTSCAVDYVSWSNILPPGESVEGGVRVRRFEADEQRELASFNRFSEDLYARVPSRDEELEWLHRQGPYVPQLVEALRREAPGFDAVIFFTYLYYPTWAGLAAVPERSLLVPTTHDEPPLRFSIFKEMFERPAAFGFLTSAEEALVRSRFDLRGRPGEVAGVGIDLDFPVDVPAFRRRHGLSHPYALYAGRIDAGKGCAELIEFFARYAAEHAAAPELILIGSLAMELPERPGLRYLGFVSEADKRSALAGAEVVLCPSQFESLSIVLLEALSHRVPVLVNERSPVLKEHCVRSQAGLFYENADEFVLALHRLLIDRDLRTAMGTSGRRYVEDGYAWPAVLARYRRLIDAAAQAT